MVQSPVPFGRYKLLNLLGEGGMAKVYRALLSGPMGFEKEVALKRLDVKLTSDERVVKALINEARLGGQLKHKNIVEIYEFNQIHGHYFMAMEYVDGWTLEALVRRCRNRREHLPASVVYEIITNICKGLEYAHGLEDKVGRALNLVHRDLKPANVMVSRDGEVKLMDFGIAKADSNLYKTTAADVTKGTPVYMSPEQVTGAKLDQRSDLFSLGSIIIELITNEIPFSADNLLAIMHAVLNADIAKSMEEVQARMPKFAPIVMLAMAKDVEDRFESASAMMKALRKLRFEIRPGPTLTEWLEDNMAELPEATTTGEFGPDGAPRPLSPRGTESLAAIAALDAEASLLSLRQSGEVKQPPGPSVSVGSAAPLDETADQPPLHGPAPARSETPGLGPMTKEFFDGDVAGGLTPGAKSPSDVPPTRIQASVSGPGPALRKRSKSGPRSGRSRKLKRKANRLPVMVAGASALAAILFVIVVALRTDRTEAVVDPPDPVPSVDLTAPVTAGAMDGSDSTAATPESIPEVTPDVTPAEASTATQTTPEPAPTPKPVGAAPTPRPPKAEPVAAAPTPVPKPPTKAPGTVQVNAKPWANLFLDGAPFGRTPRKDVSIPAGKHTLRFECANCDPPLEQTVTFTLEPGGRFKKIVKFPAQ